MKQAEHGDEVPSRAASEASDIPTGDGETDTPQAAEGELARLKDSMELVHISLHATDLQYRRVAAELQRRRARLPDMLRRCLALLRAPGMGRALAGLVAAAMKSRRVLRPRHFKDALFVVESGLFDADFYAQQYADVRESGVDPLLHYITEGAGQGRQPHALFDTRFYLEHYPALDPMRVNPLVHYLTAGSLDRTWPNAKFDPGTYTLRYPEVLQSGVDPLVHYARGSGQIDPPRAVRKALQDQVAYMKRSTNYPARELAGPDRFFDAGHLHLHWIVPDFGRGDGGIMNIIRMIAYLEQVGHANTLWVQHPYRYGYPDEVHELVNNHFAPLKGPVAFLPEDPDSIVGDAVIATDRWTAYAARAVSRVRRRFYFVQDYEPLFYAAGSEHLLTEATYRFGFDCLCNGAWLGDLMREKYGAWTHVWHQAFDPKCYHAGDEEARSANRIAFYGRHGTPRRAVELGVLAFDVLHDELGVDFHVDFFGQHVGELASSFPYTDHGVMSALELGDLYRTAAVGIGFSSTNYSIVTREMMACGLPIVELDVEGVRAVYPEDCLALAEPTPQAIAAKIKHVLEDRDYREQVVKAATAFARQFSWEQAGRDVETGIRERLAEG